VSWVRASVWESRKKLLARYLGYLLTEFDKTFTTNGMALSPDKIKSDAMLLGTRQRSSTFVSVRSVDVAGC